jgi:uncharacterized delta-60 repeat protein
MYSTTLKRALLLIFSILFVASLKAAAQAGTLDPTFGKGGIFISKFKQSGNDSTFLNAVAIQSDGKILIGGSTPASAAVVRLNTNGTLDATFGVGGIANFGTAGVQAFAMVVQPDGKIVAAASGDETGLVARFNVDGSLDTTFGKGGIATPSSLISEPGVSNGLAVQPNGEILLTGFGLMGRLTSAGQLDTSFGVGGFVPLASQVVTAMTLQSDGKILVTTGAGAPTEILAPFSLAPTPQPGAIARYNANGSLDKTFGAAGQAACVASAAALAIQSDGKILVAGTIPSALLTDITSGRTFAANQTGFGLVRYNSNGSIDTTFNGGIAITGFGRAFPAGNGFSLAIQSNGEIVVAGQAGALGASLAFNLSSFALARYTTTGKPDTAFGTKGTVITTIGQGNISFVSALVVQGDGKIVAAGNSGPPPPSVGGQYVPNFAIARYLGQ